MGVSVSRGSWNDTKQGWDINLSMSWASNRGITLSYKVEAYHGGWIFVSDSVMASYTDETTCYGSVNVLGFPPYSKIVVITGDGSSTTYNVPPHNNHYWDNYFPPFRPKIQTQQYTNDVDGVWQETWCCVCNALTACREKIEFDIRGVTYARYSIGWLYGNVNRNISNEYAGMMTVDALNVMQNEGVPYFSRVTGGNIKVYPDVYLLNDMVKNGKTLIGAKSLYRLNQNNPYTQHGRIDSHEFKQTTNVLSIMNNVKNKFQGVAMSIIISSEFDSASQSTSGICGRLSKTSSNRGNHVIMIIGWKKIGDEYYWICHNSWGKNSGDGGLIYVPVSWYYNSTSPVRGIIGYDIMYGSDYGSDKFEWDSPKTKSNTIENKLSASEWNALQKYVMDAYLWKFNKIITFPSAIIGNTLSASAFNAVRTKVTSWLGLGGEIPVESATQNNPIKANEHLNAIRDSVNSIY